MKTFRLAIIVLISGVLIAGCSGLFPTSQPQASQQESPAVAVVELEPPTREANPVVLEPATNTPEAMQTASSSERADAASPTGLPNPTDTPQIAEPPPVRQGLAASNPDDFVFAAGQVQLVEFFAFWWPTCQAMAPVVHGLEAKYYDRLNFVYLDIDDGRTDSIKQSLGYVYQPHIFLVDGNGNVIEQWVGYVTSETLEAAILGATGQ